MVWNFLHSERGAVTVDWVFLTGGILMLGIAVVFGVFNMGVEAMATSINAEMLNAAIEKEIGSAPGQQRFSQP